ncbi:MliC family protein [Longimonas sp.]|uniref:MliC family protein n=1 Tax=Longimonas sp. TaxID=2039626 RepID=UPI0039757FFA
MKQLFSDGRSVLVACLVGGIVLILAGCGGDSDSSSECATEAGDRATFQCDSGTVIQVEHPTDSTAVLTYDDQTLRLTNAPSTSATRYTGDKREWWVKGRGEGARGTLFARVNPMTGPRRWKTAYRSRPLIPTPHA